MRRDPDGTLRVKPEGAARGPEKRVLLDRRDDPRETRDVRARHPQVAGELAAQLEAMLADATRRREELGPDTALDLPESRLEELRRLGYLP